MSSAPELRVGILSDLHHGVPVRREGQWRKLGPHALDLAEAFVEHMNADVRPDVVVHLGDAIEDRGEPAADRRGYAEVMARLATLEAPVLHLTGNHDERTLSEAELRDLRGGAVSGGPLEVGGYTLVSLSTHSGGGTCWSTAEEVARLEGSLGVGRGPVLLFSHHPLADQDVTGNVWFDGHPEQCLVAERAVVRARLVASGRVRACFCGHMHWNRLDVHDGLPYFTVHSAVENVAPTGAEPLPAEAWTLAEVGADWLRVRVFGNAPAHWEWPSRDGLQGVGSANADY